MNKVKKYPVTKNGIDYTVKIREYYDMNSWSFDHMCKIKIYKGNSCIPWNKVYECNVSLEEITPKEAVKQAFVRYENHIQTSNIENAKWQELLDWDGNLDKTN